MERPTRPEEPDLTPYSWIITITTRYEDVGQEGCLGSAAYARFFEQARVTFIDDLLAECDDSAAPLPLMVVAGWRIDYLEEGAYGPPVQVGLGVRDLGRSSYRMEASCVQDGRVLALHSAVMVLTGVPGGLPPRLQASLRSRLVSGRTPQSGA